MPRKETYSGPLSAQAQQDLVSEGIENYELPKSLVMKIAKSAIPENIKLQKETVLSLVKGSTVFINYLAATAHDVAQSKQHKSISASDVLKALEMLEFGDMASKLQGELQIYRDLTKTEPNPKGKKSVPVGPAAASAKKNGSISSASTAAKGKGKEKALPGDPLPPPFTSAPLDLAGSAPYAGESISGSGPMDVDDEDQGIGASAREEIEMDYEGDGQDDIGQEELDEEDEDEAEELVNTVALEEEELRKDGRVLDEGKPVRDDDD
ncbi:unnamed protein product [Cyclocybe aegerita]|uniref:DNA polymerase epsilon subunit D n=1 Tax=Cyclocybe aegerita TaxID=1973307 RepID=A0A8S0W6A1_CYCAE|nr:unnamed protein product [Cyclocybe aegerita]